MTEVSWPLPGRSEYCVLIPDFLSAAECRAYIERAEARGFVSAHSDYPPSYRDNDRQVFDDPELAERWLARVRPFAPATISAPEGGEWALVGINERFRYCRYQPGQQFQLHQDGVHHRGDALQSRLTFMIYLTDPAAFEGGDTVFYANGPGGDVQVIGRVRPSAGSLILFAHELWHAGALVTGGIKHVLRSELLYQRRTVSPEPESAAFQPAHLGYVWTLAKLGGGQFASGGRDRLIRIWHEDGRALGILSGHSQSVLGLAAFGENRLASVSRDRSLRLWDLDTGRCEAAVEAHQATVLTVLTLPSGLLATGGADHLLKLWSAQGRVRTQLAGHTGWIWALAAFGEHDLVSASEDGALKLWDARDRRCLHTLAEGVALRAAAVSEDSQELLAGNVAGEIVRWSYRTGRWQVSLRWQAHAAAIRRLRFLSPQVLASTGEDNRVCIWRWPTCTLHQDIRHNNFATDVLALANGAFLSCSYDGRLRRHAALL